MEFDINKGVGKPLEFKGLKAQYVLLFVGGLATVIFIVIIMGAIKLPSIIPILTGVIGCGAVIYYSFRYNKIYGQYGLMKKRAQTYHPTYVISRKSPRRILKTQCSTRQSL